MPQTITNPDIIKIIDANVAEMESINKANEEITKRCEELNKQAQVFTDKMNEEYGWGNWQDVDAKAYTFKSRDEIDTSKFYIIHNPAIREKLDTEINVEVSEAKPEELN